MPSGDFWQTLPIISRGTMADEVSDCLKSSSLWKYTEVLKLTKNMRLTSCNTDMERFVENLFKIGKGAAQVND